MGRRASEILRRVDAERVAMREEARRKRYQAEHVEPIPAEPERDLREVAEDVLGLLGGRSLTTRSKKSGREHVILMAPLPDDDATEADAYAESYLVRRLKPVPVEAPKIPKRPPTIKRTGDWGLLLAVTLTNTIYRGVLVFGMTRDRKDGEGHIVRVKSPEAPVTAERPDLRIIDDRLWQAVAERKAATAALRDPRGRLQGKPEQRTLASTYLLSGFLACHACGGSRPGR
jgi:hypothetical protein